MEQNREPRNGHINMPYWFLTKIQKQFNGGRIAFSTDGTGTVGQPQAIKQTKQIKTQPKPHALYKNQLKMDHGQIVYM